MTSGGTFASAEGHSHSFDLRGTDVRALARVRRWIAAELAELGPAHIGDVIQVADELAANAYEHAGGPCAIHLHQRREPCLTTIEVDDAAPTKPTVGRSRFEKTANRGRGLVLVTRLAHAWGVRDTHRGPGGKTVWAQVTCDR